MANAISINKIINVNSSVVSAGFTGVSLVGLFLTENKLIQAYPVEPKSFTSAAAVGSYFGLQSSEYQLAQVYFKSYTGSLSYPSFIKFVSANPLIGSDAYLIGKIVKSPTALVSSVKALATPELTIVANNTDYELTLSQSDFSADVSISDIAETINTNLALQTTDFEVSITDDSRFQIVSTSNTDTIDYCPSGNIADLLTLTADTSEVISQGTVSIIPTELMESIVDVDTNWMSFSYVERLTGDDETSGYPISVELAEWVGTKQNDFVFFPWSNNANCLNTSSATNIATIFRNAGLGTRTPDTSSGQTVYNVPMSVIWGANDSNIGVYSAFYASIGSSTNYTQRNARTNFAGKRQTGLSTNVNNNSDFDALTQQAFQVYGSFSSAAQGYQFTEDGSVGGEFLWIDNLYDSRWLSDQIQNSLATLISNSKNISYTSDGISKVEAVLNGVATTAINAGVIQSGNTFDETQIASFVELTGTDVSAQMTAQGYYIYFPPVTPAQRASRSPLQVTFLYTNGGSINKFSIGKVFYV